MPALSTLLLHTLGTVGLVLLLGAYYLVSAGRLAAGGARYQWLNFAGAIVLVVYSALLGAWASVALNVIWAAIALRTLATRGR